MTRRWVRVLLILSALALAIVLAVSTVFAAETVHLYVKVDGTQINGESTQKSLGRENSIECVSIEQSVEVNKLQPIKCIKRVDKSSPLLLKTLMEKKNVEAQFRFFRPNPTGDGTTQQFYTIELKGAQITNYRMWVPNTMEPGTSTLPPMEEVTFTFKTISWTYVPENITTGNGERTK